MSTSIDHKEIKTIILSLKEDNTNEIQWTNFVLVAKQQIVKSSSSFKSSNQLRLFWIRTVTNIAVQNGYTLNTGTDNWFLIEKELQYTSSSSTSASQGPPSSPSTSASPSSPTKIKRRSSSISGISLKSCSSLGTPISESKKEDSLVFYKGLKTELKWKLKSGRYVEDIMANFVSNLEFNHPSMHCILDMNGSNWDDIFFDEEKNEINEIAKADIEYPPLPPDMQNFLKNIPNNAELDDIYDYLESTSLKLSTQAPLVYLKVCLQHAIRLFHSGYLPLSSQKERDICTNVWHIFSRAFENSPLTLRIEATSAASKAAIFKKRKISSSEIMPKQATPLIPDMTVSRLGHEYAIVEAAKSHSDTKQINEESKKCPELMQDIFKQLLATCPSAQRDLKVYGCLLSRLDCTPLELSNPKGYVYIYRRASPFPHAEDPNVFKATMTNLLAHIWRFRLATEDVYKIVIEAQNQQSQFV